MFFCLPCSFRRTTFSTAGATKKKKPKNIWPTRRVMVQRGGPYPCHPVALYASSGREGMPAGLALLLHSKRHSFLLRSCRERTMLTASSNGKYALAVHLLVGGCLGGIPWVLAVAAVVPNPAPISSPSLFRWSVATGTGAPCTFWAKLMNDEPMHVA